MKIDFVDLKRQYQNIKQEIDEAINTVVSEANFILGNDVDSFEERFSTLIGTKHCISVANGTDSLFIIMKSLGIGKGDEVITVCNSWISSSETIGLTGAKPVFTDINPHTLLMDIEDLKSKITKNTKAIIPVHLFGNPCNIEAIKEIAEEHNLLIIEDCAQSHLATSNGNNVGTFGIASSFSFFPGKNLGAYGDAGCILTNDEDLARKCRIFARHGAIKKHDHLIEGINSRMDNLQAAILNVKIKHLEKWTEQRREIAKEYRKGLNGLPVIIPELEKNTNSSYHLFIIQIRERDELKDFLESNGISCGIHYPKIIPLQKAYSNYGYTEKDFPIGFEKQSQILSLPIFPEMTKNEINFVLKKIHEFFRK